MASFHQVQFGWAQRIAEEMTRGECTVRVLQDERGIDRPRSVSLWLRERSSGRVARVPLDGELGEIAESATREARLRALVGAARAGLSGAPH